MSVDKWDNPVFHEGRIWGRMEEQARIIGLLKTFLQNDDGEGLTIFDEDGMRCVLGLDTLISLIEGEK